MADDIDAQLEAFLAGKPLVEAPRRLHVVPEPLVGDGTKWGLKALHDECAELAAMEPNSGRNDKLNAIAWRMKKMVNGGQLREQYARDRLWDAAMACGLGQGETTKTLASAFGSTTDVAQPQERERYGDAYVIGGPAPLITPTPTTPEEPTLEELEQDFWTARSSLRLIYTAALSAMASPWAVAGCCAVRTLARIPPAITLPPIIGGPGSLNFFVAISAKSGGGKGAAMSVAEQLVRDDAILVRGIGSGEGMIEAYNRGKPLKDDEEDKSIVSVLFSIDEIDSLGAMGQRSGQTTMAIIRQGFSGERLGYSYRGRQSEVVAAHTYRMTVVASVQPERAGVLFDDAGGGTPQRFMWFPARDKRIVTDPPPWPDDQYGPQRIPQIGTTDMSHHLGYVQVPDVTTRMIREARVRSMQGDENALDGHALFCREKFAYALAVMDGHMHITDEDWRLSGIAAAVSDWWRTKAREGYRKGKERASREKGEMRAYETDESDLTLRSTQARHVQRVAEYVMTLLAKHGPMTRGALNKQMASRDRPRLDTALTAAEEQGLLTREGDQWRLTLR